MIVSLIKRFLEHIYEISEVTITDDDDFETISTDYHGVMHLRNNKIAICISKNYPYAKFIIHDSTHVLDAGNNVIECLDQSDVTTTDDSTSTIIARDTSRVSAYGKPHVYAYDESFVYATNDTTVDACNQTTVHADGNAIVRAGGHTVVNAKRVSRIYANESAHVDADGFVSVYARGYATVNVLSEYCDVTAFDNTVIYGISDKIGGSNRIHIYNNSRFIYSCINTKPNIHTRYFVLLRPTTPIFPGVGMVSSNDRQIFVECELKPIPALKMEYKVAFHPVIEGFGVERMYTSSMKTYIEFGMMIQKIYDWQEVVEETWREPLYGNLYLEHSAFTVV